MSRCLVALPQILTSEDAGCTIGYFEFSGSSGVALSGMMISEEPGGGVLLD